MKRKTFYWHDPINDDFAGNNIKTITLPANYKYYSRNPIYLFLESLTRLVVIPVCYIILKVGFAFKVKNKKVLRKAKKKGYFLYANHTNALLDAYAPTVVAFPKKVNVIANPDAVSIKGLATFVKMLGVVPIPTSIKGLLKYKEAINNLAKKYHRVIMIYPEAHIWPYYTDIRPFGKQSFHYPIETNLPCFTMTNIYKKRHIGKRPKVITYIDGPFYPDQSLIKSEQIQALRNSVYDAMKKRIDSNPKYAYCNYVYVDDKSILTSKK